MTRLVSRWPPSADERGTALIEVTWLSILLLVPLLYVVLAVFEVQRSAFAVSGAARAAARAYAVAPNEAAARAQGRGAALIVLRDHDVETARTEVRVRCEPLPENCLAPGSVITVDVSHAVSLPLMPSAFGGDTPSVRVAAVHRVPYGTFREDR